jgi:hypothetical protein
MQDGAVQVSKLQVSARKYRTVRQGRKCRKVHDHA